MEEIYKLRVEHLVKKYGHKTVVRDVSFTMESGQIIGLLGPNGAGKTTSFYIIVGFIKSNGGKIFINDNEITTLPMFQRSKLGLSYLPQESSIFRKLSVYDNLKIAADTRKDLNKKEKKELIDNLLENFGLTNLKKQLGYSLSGGERRRCEIARSLVNKPRFLLLDEPFAGIDPKAVYEIKQIIKKLSEQNIGILLTDHNVRDTLTITHLSHIIHEGKIVISGDKNTLIQDKIAKDIYFGHGFEKDVL